MKNTDNKGEIVDELRIRPTRVFTIDELDIEKYGSHGHAKTIIQRKISIHGRRLCKDRYNFITNVFENLRTFSQLYGLIGITFTLIIPVFALTFTCWPYHNVILYPEYWYELIIPMNLTYGLTLASSVFIDAKLLLQANEILTLRSFWFYCFLRILGNVIIFVLLYFIWVKCLNLPYPMPHAIAVFGLLNAFLIAPIGNWLIFPPELKSKDHPFRKKILRYIFLNWLRIMMAIGYKFIPGLAIVKKEHLQWSLCLLLPMVSKFNVRWTSMFTKWAFGCDDEVCAFESTIFVKIIHSFSLTIILGSSQINLLTTISLMFVDTLMNAMLVRNIIRNHHLVTDHEHTNRDRSLRLLALKEFLEILVPISYCLSYSGSYMGPNHDIIGGIGSNVWHHESVSSLYGKIEKILLFMMAEFIRGVIFAVILWKFYDLNMYSAYCDVIRNYGVLILTHGAYVNISVNDCYLLALKHM